mmetsp:Transcript_32225/g.70589  ORF Transcript_32225/g.70589 Transcript_32225/m.70589 type:complete len:258 (-) Transcript_32225:1456-2229(-)
MSSSLLRKCSACRVEMLIRGMRASKGSVRYCCPMALSGSSTHTYGRHARLTTPTTTPHGRPPPPPSPRESRSPCTASDSPNSAKTTCPPVSPACSAPSPPSSSSSSSSMAPRRAPASHRRIRARLPSAPPAFSRCSRSSSSTTTGSYRSTPCFLASSTCCAVGCRKSMCLGCRVFLAAASLSAARLKSASCCLCSSILDASCVASAILPRAWSERTISSASKASRSQSAIVRRFSASSLDATSAFIRHICSSRLLAS